MARTLTILFLLLAMGSVAQKEDSLAIVKQINSLFDGMRAGDSSKVRSVFNGDVRLYTSIVNKKGEAELRVGSLETFISGVGIPHPNVWDEKISNLVIQIDDNLAQAWMDYKFYLGDKFIHCGVNAIQLTKVDGIWKMIHLIDTRRKEGCQ